MPVAKPGEGAADAPDMRAPAACPSQDPRPADWREPTWFDRGAAWLRRRLRERLGIDPWSAGLAAFGTLYLVLGLGSWLVGLAQGASPWTAALTALLLVVLAVRFLSELAIRLAPRPLPRLQPAASGSPDLAFWKALRRAGVNVRIARALHAGGIRDREDVRRRSDAELLAIPGVGRRTLARLRAVVEGLQEAPP